MKKVVNADYQETSEPTFVWEMKKKLFALTRYGFNVLLLGVGAAVVYIMETVVSLPRSTAFVAGGVIGLCALCMRVAYEWERVPVLRLGRHIKTAGPGLFFVIPFIDRPYGYVDCRITVTDFTAEKTLTRDAVPVYVDAIIFWMIWDAGKAKLEVENYELAVPLSAKTALRDIIGKTTLADLLTERDAIGDELQKILDAKTNPWGITSLSVDIKNIVVPKELEDAISREAQAQREKNARIILGSAEVELSEQYAAASEKYKGNDEALTLRSLNMLLEAVKSKGSMILVPSETPKAMNKALSMAMARNAGAQQLPDNATEAAADKAES
jgi:regulator of protease activity HflC (stomatin/prohibitin superfamily)